MIRITFTSYTPCKKLSMLLTKSSKILDSSSDWLLMIRQKTLLNPTLPPTLKTSNLAFRNRLFIFADFLCSSFIFPEFLRRLSSQFFYLRRLSSQFLHLRDFLRSSFIFADFLRSSTIFADFPCSPLNIKLQNVSN